MNSVNYLAKDRRVRMSGERKKSEHRCEPNSRYCTGAGPGVGEAGRSRRGGIENKHRAGRLEWTRRAKTRQTEVLFTSAVLRNRSLTRPHAILLQLSKSACSKTPVACNPYQVIIYDEAFPCDNRREGCYGPRHRDGAPGVLATKRCIRRCGGQRRKAGMPEALIAGNISAWRPVRWISSICREPLCGTLRRLATRRDRERG